ncbi:hypothetical protein [Massilia antarctica]|uniref:hypothetical protein n=1 Tax=Massilia antarctica TaxID=2765360 RepID=UPI0006BD4732|nr:hypothetical protein [Massilia sp. H27-R4]MCY0912057.1 hypothetical protein [Massilia sp. H27-R4]CUI06477.1 hypothetical protein BN2497_7731 [Janthinobacterium sp. CG23_2]CUU30263.1 hypothetical protein BN3177_7731 [Janthinobacterium sp. CG23_2]
MNFYTGMTKNMMDIDLLKIVGPMIIGVIGIPLALPAVLKAWAEYKNIHRAMLRVESDFSWALAEKIDNADLRRYAEKLSYSAVVWDNRLTHAQRTAILSLQENAKAVMLYLKCPAFVLISPHAPMLSWRVPSHAKSRNRTLFKLRCYLAYFLFAFIGFTPLLAWHYDNPEKYAPVELWIFEALVGSPFLWWGIKLLTRKEQMVSAERLMELAVSEPDPDSRD